MLTRFRPSLLLVCALAAVFFLVETVDWVTTGFVSAGTNIGVGVLLKAAISSPTVLTEAVKESLASGIFGSVLYFVIGILFFMLGYLVIRFFNKKYNLNDEVGCGNTAAGIMVAGIFIGLAIVISGVIA